jgi:nucleoid-associated protein EbfC
VIDNEQSLQEIMERVQAVQQELMSAHSDVNDTEVTGSAGGGLVTVTMRGSGEVTSVRFEQSVVDEGDAEALAALTMTALRHATDELRMIATERMAAVTNGLEGTFGAYGNDALGAYPRPPR